MIDFDTFLYLQIGTATDDLVQSPCAGRNSAVESWVDVSSSVAARSDGRRSSRIHFRGPSSAILWVPVTCSLSASRQSAARCPAQRRRQLWFCAPDTMHPASRGPRRQWCVSSWRLRQYRNTLLALVYLLNFATHVEPTASAAIERPALNTSDVPPTLSTSQALSRNTSHRNMSQNLINADTNTDGAPRNRSLSAAEMFRDARAQNPRPTGLIDLFEWALVFILIAPGSFPAFSCIALACMGFWRRRYAAHWPSSSSEGPGTLQVSGPDDETVNEPLWDPAKSRRRIRSTHFAAGYTEDLEGGSASAAGPAGNGSSESNPGPSFHAE
jgi:hypothetical protein